ncbi:MAG: LamB/YcsF family protein [Bacteroidetes bacterium]|nr:MAG: LamB/YcsF family protein [Bacteroidota bacterium]
MGESIGQLIIGNDEAVFPYITSCSIACGFHGGDEVHMKRTVISALARGIRIGAHPSYRDLEGFGRREMQLPPQELRSIIKYQVSALKEITERQGGKLEYVKPHGALYNKIARDKTEATIVYEAIQEIDPSLCVMGLAGSIAVDVARELGIRFIAEAFADRTYEADGTLTSRAVKGAVISDPNKAVAQVLSIILDKQVETTSGKKIPISADSICIHGDNESAIDILIALEDALNSHPMTKRNHPS